MDRTHSLSVFSELPQPEAASILAQAEARSYRRRQHLFRQGEPVSGLFLIRSGTVKLSQLGRERDEVIMRLAGEGEVIAALAAFARPDRFPVAAAALDEVDALFWARRAARRLAREHPGFAAALTREIGRQARGFQERLRELATERIPQRLARLLLRLAEQAGVPDRDGVRIDIPLTRRDLAQMTGTTLYTVSRLLSEWAERGLVTTGRARVTVRSRRGLERLAARSSD